MFVYLHSDACTVHDKLTTLLDRTFVMLVVLSVVWILDCCVVVVVSAVSAVLWC